MKKLFLVCAVASFFSACNSDSKSGMETTKEVVADTSVQYENSVNTDTAKIAPVPLAAPVPKAEVRKETKTSSAKKVHTTHVIKNEPAVSTTTTTTTAPATTTSTTDNTKTTTTTPTPDATPEKKGMNSRTKDAIIGGGVGAVGGAIISKKKGKGAIIGGLLGAGAGYIIGKKKDKQDTAR